MQSVPTSNIDGSFSCACDSGYVGDGVTCTGQFTWNATWKGSERSEKVTGFDARG